MLIRLSFIDSLIFLKLGVDKLLLQFYNSKCNNNLKGSDKNVTQIRFPLQRKSEG